MQSVAGSVKCVAVGDGAVGKTCLLNSFTQKEFSEEHIPTVLDTFGKTIMFKWVSLHCTVLSVIIPDNIRTWYPDIVLFQWPALRAQPVRHGGSGGVRQAPSPRLPRHRRVPRLLQPHDPWQFRKRQVGDREDLNDNDNNYAHLREKWIPEIRHHCPKTPFVLVGTKGDCRQDRGLVDKLGTNRIK